MCKEKYDYFRKHGQCYRQQHLTNCLKAAKEREDDAAECNILAIIKREKDKAFWRWLNYALGKHVRGRSVRAVQVGRWGWWGAGLRHQGGSAGGNF